MTKQELGALYMNFIRALALAGSADCIVTIGPDGKPRTLPREEGEVRAKEGLLKCQRILNDHFALLLSALGVSADEFIGGTAYVPRPVLLRFRSADGSVVEVDYEEQLWRPRFGAET